MIGRMKCTFCGNQIAFREVAKGERVPVDPDGGDHRERCAGMQRPYKSSIRDANHERRVSEFLGSAQPVKAAPTSRVQTERPRHVITESWLEKSIASGAITKLQAAALNLPWPPPKGWRRALLGESITQEQKAAVEAGLSKKSAQKRGSMDLPW